MKMMMSEGRREKKKNEQNERLKGRGDGEAREPSGREVGEG